MVTINANSQKAASTTFSPVKKQLFYQIPYSNIILICDDELYRKSLINSARSIRLSQDYELNNDALGSELADYQSNVLIQVN